MFDKLENMIKEQTVRVEAMTECSLLSDSAKARFSENLHKNVETVSKSTVTHMLVQQVGDDNPLAALDPAMLTDAQHSYAEKAVNEALNNGTLTLPAPLTDILALHLKNVTDAFIEMLGRLDDHREELGALLPDGKTFTRIEDIIFSAGDTHNHGRSVTVLYTDAGRLVYKPRDMRGEAGIYELVQRYFPDVLGIPECIAFGDSFGVSRYIEKSRAEGEEEARRFWYRMGGAACVFKLLGSTDMHVENLICSDGKPYVIDLETIASAEISNADHEMLHPELSRLKSTSPYLSLILPIQHDGRELCTLTNTDDDGCAPVVNGKRVTVCGYISDFTAGYKEIYRRILAKKEEISRFVTEISAVLPVRILMRNTQFYHDTMIRLCHHASLANAQARERSLEILEKLLQKKIREEFYPAVRSEIDQIKCGDIPYFYSCAGDRHLYGGGEAVVRDVFDVSAGQHILNNIAAMGEKDLAFDLQLLERAIEQYPRRLPEDEQKTSVNPVLADRPLSREQALIEAKRQFDLISDLSIKAPDGKLFWGFTSEPTFSFHFCETGFSNGLTGIAVFAAAYAFAAGNENEKKFAADVLHEAVTELKRFYEYYEKKDFPPDQFPNLGESDGMGGILNALALIRRYNGGEEIAQMQEKALLMISRYGFSRYGAPDRMIGISGLLSVLCRFDEYKVRTDLIASAADQLLTMKTQPYQEKLLWRPIQDKQRPISGGGHGLAGIAQALYAASTTLGDEKYAHAAEDAIAFELQAYNEKYHTWSDLRSYPPVGYMHGYCSGAPGIGIMLERIRQSGHDSEDIRKCADLAEKSVDGLPLNLRDHLCCGNSAVVEYYMTVGHYDKVGRVLAAMQHRSVEEGDYRYLGYNYHNGVTPSLFYGAAGIGYEMLRYACPEKIISVI